MDNATKAQRFSSMETSLGKIGLVDYESPPLPFQRRHYPNRQTAARCPAKLFFENYFIVA